MSCSACPSADSEAWRALCAEGAGRDNAGADINECTLTPGLCAHGACENLEPGYRCICDPGFRQDRHGGCVDVDECAMHDSVSFYLLYLHILLYVKDKRRVK